MTDSCGTLALDIDISFLDGPVDKIGAADVGGVAHVAEGNFCQILYLSRGGIITIEVVENKHLQNGDD